jgi:hypothetical protein
MSLKLPMSAYLVKFHGFAFAQSEIPATPKLNVKITILVSIILQALIFAQI